jgi:serine/threonine protein kinase/CRP-like cAMP-binding protein
MFTRAYGWSASPDGITGDGNERMETFGRYQLLKRVAVGGMAEIFLARSAGLDGFEKDLIIKRIRPDYSADVKFSSLFIDEAKISISLSHQNIVQVFDFGQAEGAYYLAMEHIYGCDLDKLGDLEEVEGKGLDPALALFIMGEVCRGLDYAHNKKDRRGELLGLVHRDVSPQNIMVSFDGGVKLTDFGIAKACGRTSQTDPGVVLGKLAYMAPEHATGQETDHRADIFAAGVVLWELLVGDRVYAGEVGPDFYRRIRDAEIQPPSSRNKKLNRKLDKLVMRAVAAAADDRYASAREFGDQIQEYMIDKYPRVGHYELQEFLEKHRQALGVVGFDELELNQEPTSPQAAPRSSPDAMTPRTEPSQAPIRVAALAAPAAEQFDWTPELIEVVETFRRAPSLWHLMTMGSLCGAAKQERAAVACYRVAAIKFAQRGLLAQALLCCRRLLRFRPFTELQRELVTYPSFIGRSNVDIAPALFATNGQMEELLQELLADTDPTHGVVASGTPLLRNLSGEAFATLAFQAPLRVFEEGAKILEQGASGRAMYLIAAGRALVYATNAQQGRVYLSSLTAGDFVGENGFFTGAPRSATVEALYPVEAFEIHPALYEKLMGRDPAAQSVMLKFYKERIVDVVLAKSPIFGLLPNDDRRAIIDRFDLTTFEAGQIIINEGELSDQIYLIKDGTAEVFTTQGGTKRPLSTLGPGTLFGEVAALRRIARTASVVASTKLEALRLGSADFHAILGAKPDVRQKVLEVVAARVRENLDRLVGPKAQS